jgi:hypothetical protein
MTIRSPESIRQLLDRICAGQTWVSAMAAIGARSEGAGWEWKRKSREAEAAGDTSSPYFIDWPRGTPPMWLHHLLDRARDTRGQMLATPLLSGNFNVEDGKIKLVLDELALPVIGEHGVPVAEQVLVAKPTPKVRVRQGDFSPIDAAQPRRGRPPISGTGELQPSSYSGNKPTELPPVAYTGNAMTDYINKNAPKPKRTGPPTELEKDLRSYLTKPPGNPKPKGAVQVLGRGGDIPDRVSQPSNQAGLPTRAPSLSAPMDYSRRPPAR